MQKGEEERENKMDVKAITDMLETYVRPATFPVGLKMLQPGEAFPPRTRTPADLGSHFATCQQRHNMLCEQTRGRCFLLD